MGCFVVTEFLLTTASQGPSPIAEPLVFYYEQAISASTGPIFMIFSPNGRYLFDFSLSGPVFLIPQETLLWQPILWQYGAKLPKPPALIALSFRNGME